ncbi:hypothetical protein WCT98_03915, partial [Pectobacterium brasiliense]|uniref:hypothetical protein n=1 Tax=Pectobacterium brasiliense TaxID=180957 RepID=UPI003018B13B
AQLVWDQWVGGSNPLSPTNYKEKHIERCAFFFACNLPSLAKALPNSLTRQGVVVPCDIVRYGA